jgi:hypothetical protein
MDVYVGALAPTHVASMPAATDILILPRAAYAGLGS